MRYKNLYEISFYIRRNGWKKFLINLEAFNQKEAIQLAKDHWYKYHDEHMFSIKIRNIPLDEVVDLKHWFVRVE